MLHKAVFLDRDGTLVKSYGNRPANTVEELELLPGVHEGLSLLVDAGYKLIVVTNQGGIGLGYLTFDTMHKMNAWLVTTLGLKVARDLAVFWCPHKPTELCSCRKPNPGMIYAAAYEHNIDLKKSFLIGDDEKDVQAGRHAGLLASVLIDDKLNFLEAVKMICAF